MFVKFEVREFKYFGESGLEFELLQSSTRGRPSQCMRLGQAGC